MKFKKIYIILLCLIQTFVISVLLNSYCFFYIYPNEPIIIEELDGSILLSGYEEKKYTPKTGMVEQFTWRTHFMEPTFHCKYEGDTLIVTTIEESIFEENKYKYIFEKFYKYIPSTHFLISIDALNDRSNDIYRIHYNKDRKLFICGSSGENNQYYFIIMDNNFDSIGTFSEKSLKNNNNDVFNVSFFYFASEGIIFSEDWKSYYIPFDDIDKSKVTKTLPGKIIAVSNDYNKVVYETTDKNYNYDYYLYDFQSDATTEIDINHQVGRFCFSPDDKYIAYDLFTKNLGNAVILFIYDIEDDKHMSTGFIFSYSETIIWID